MAERFSLKDHLFNPETVGQLAGEYAGAIADFDPEKFTATTLQGFANRELMERLDWIADCLEPFLASDFPTMADQLQRALPPPLDPDLTDDDFGHFIHAVPGILAVRHGLEDHRERALDLLHEATKCFSMEYYIRPFLNRWPDETLARLRLWTEDSNYHVRRLVSEGTRPRLPWAKAVQLTPDQTLPLLENLHADPTRYVTRSVCNHLNDLTKNHADLVLQTLQTWRERAEQTSDELNWMHRHALRTLIKQGHAQALLALGYRNDIDIDVELTLGDEPVQIGTALKFAAELRSATPVPVLVDYVIWFVKADGTQAPKTFKLKTAELGPDGSLKLAKTHKLKADATTFRLYPGRHMLGLQVNGRIVARAEFDLLSPEA